MKETQKALDKLVSEIYNTKEYTNYSKAKEKWGKAVKSQKLLEDFFKARNIYNIYIQGKFPDAEKQKKEVEALHKKVVEDKNITEWLNAQKKYQDFIWSMGDYLSKKLTCNFSSRPRHKKCMTCC